MTLRRIGHVQDLLPHKGMITMKKNTAIFLGVGCGGAIVILVIIGISVVTFVPKMFDWVGQMAAEEQERHALADNWQPPEKDTISESFFPPKVAGYNLGPQDKNSEIPELRIDQEGWHAVYSSGASQIDVYLYYVSELEKEALFGRVKEVYEDEDEGLKRITNLGYRLFYSSSLNHQNHLWWMKGWLLVFRTHDSEDREAFVKSFLEATSAEPQRKHPDLL